MPAGLFRRVQQLPVREGKPVTVQGALQYTPFHVGVFQRVFAMGTAGFDQVQRPLMLHQQQGQVVDAEVAAVVVMQVDQFFQGLEAHGIESANRGPP